MSVAALRELAERHGLELEEQHELGAYTPSSVAMRSAAAVGPIAAGHTGALAVRSTSSSAEGDGGALGPVVDVHMPQTIARLPQLLCRDASFRFTKEYQLTADSLERLDHETVFESAAVHRRFAVEHGAGADAVLLRRLFIPTFLDWLGEHAPSNLYFELQNGRLAVFMSEARSGADLEVLWQAAAMIVERIAGELAESRRPGEAAPFADPLPPPREDEGMREMLAGVAKVEWPQPPGDVRQAIAAYEDHAGGGAGLYLRAFAVAGGIASIFFVIGGILWLFDGFIAAVSLFALGLGLFVFLLPVAIRNPRLRRAAEWGKLAFALEFAKAESLDLEDPTAWHATHPNLALPGPVRRLWRGTSPTGTTYRLALIQDAAATGARSGYEALLVEAGTSVAAPAGAEPIEGEDVLALVRSTALDSGPTAAGLRELRDAVG